MVIENHNRYLGADFYFSNTGVAAVKETVFKRYSGDRAMQKDSFYHTFINWVQQPNEVMVSLWRHRETLTLPLNYNCIFEMDDPDNHIIANFTITQGLVNGWIPGGSLYAGNNNICILVFKDSVPPLLFKLNKSDSWAQQGSGLKNNLGFCNLKHYQAICKARKEYILEQEYRKSRTAAIIHEEKKTLWKKIVAYFKQQ
jgi:hypothetical protein